MKPAKKRAKQFSANNASKKLLEAGGWTVGVVEKRLPRCMTTVDLYGFIDLVVCKPGEGIAGVQVTAGGKLEERRRKIRAEPRHAVWLQCGGRIFLHDWRKRAGKKERDCVQMELVKARIPNNHGPEIISKINSKNP